MTIHEKLVKIQAELKAPKNQFNKFGGYKYRSAEDILEAAKPLLTKHGLYILISDNIESVGDRNYVVASVMLTDGEQSVSVSAAAREAVTKKGMDDSQITGATSSYARKYAMNGLFAIDDTKDADATNDHSEEPRTSDTPKASPNKPASTNQKNFILKLWGENPEYKDNDFLAWFEKEYLKNASEMTSAEASGIIKRLQEGNV